MLGVLVEHVDRSTEHLFRFARQVLLNSLEQTFGGRIHVTDLQVPVAEHHARGRVLEHLGHEALFGEQLRLPLDGFGAVLSVGRPSAATAFAFCG